MTTGLLNSPASQSEPVPLGRTGFSSYFVQFTTAFAVKGWDRRANVKIINRMESFFDFHG